MDEIKRGQESVAKSTDNYAFRKEPQIREKFMKTGQNINDKSLNVYRNVK